MIDITQITEELKGKVGFAAEPVVIPIEKGMIKKLTEAIEDSNPLYQDEEYARQTKYGGVIAPPTLLCATTMTGRHVTPPEEEFNVALDGGIELEFHKPIRPGDVITCTSKIFSVRERETGRGKMLFVVTEVTYKNQRDELVAKQHSTSILQ